MPHKDRKEYYRDYYQAHKEERKSYLKDWYQAHKDEAKAYREAHKDEAKAYYEAHKAEKKAYNKAYNESHRNEHKAYQKAYSKSDTNSNGVAKSSIRVRSSRYLFNVLKHTKMEGYEIHHCFGYDDYRNFIYIPKELHLQIHQYLRDNNIDADTDHYSKIAHLVVGWDGYVYIKC